MFSNDSKWFQVVSFDFKGDIRTKTRMHRRVGKVHVDLFSIACYDDSLIYLTGGRYTNAVRIFNIDKEYWRLGSYMIQSRHSHSSMWLGRKLYLFAGEGHVKIRNGESKL